jgi:hypothetical protein
MPANAISPLACQRAFRTRAASGLSTESSGRRMLTASRGRNIWSAGWRRLVSVVEAGFLMGMQTQESTFEPYPLALSTRRRQR